MSSTFKSYLSSSGIDHATSPVYHPSCNGAAERAVRTFKEGFHFSERGGDIQKALDQFLFRYRVTPHSSTGVSPAELMFNRGVRTVFDLLQPFNKVQKKVNKNMSKMQNCSKRSRAVSFKSGDKVLVKMYSKGSPKWVHAVVKCRTGAVTYRCSLPDGSVLKRHANQLWLDKSTSSQSVQDEPFDFPFQDDHSSSDSDSMSDIQRHIHSPVPFDSDQESSSSSVTSVVIQPAEVHTRSGRLVKPPDRLDL